MTLDYSKYTCAFPFLYGMHSRDTTVLITVV